MAENLHYSWLNSPLTQSFSFCYDIMQSVQTIENVSTTWMIILGVIFCFPPWLPNPGSEIVYLFLLVFYQNILEDFICLCYWRLINHRCWWWQHCFIKLAGTSIVDLLANQAMMSPIIVITYNTPSLPYPNYTGPSRKVMSMLCWT